MFVVYIEIQRLNCPQGFRPLAIGEYLRLFNTEFHFLFLRSRRGVWSRGAIDEQRSDITTPAPPNGKRKFSITPNLEKCSYPCHDFLRIVREPNGLTQTPFQPQEKNQSNNIKVFKKRCNFGAFFGH